MSKLIKDLITESEVELAKDTRIGRLLGAALKRQYVELIRIHKCKPEDDLNEALSKYPDCHLKIVDPEKEEHARQKRKERKEKEASEN